MTRACTATTAAGHPCRMPALPLTVPPRCMGHSSANGRKTTLTPDLQQRVCAALRTGVSVKTAVALAGTSHSSFYCWIHRGHPNGTDPANEPHRQFAQAVEQARAEADAARIAQVAAAATAGDWHAAAWLLERSYPQRWGLRERRPVRTRADWTPGAGDDPDDGPVAA